MQRSGATQMWMTVRHHLDAQPSYERAALGTIVTLPAILGGGITLLAVVTFTPAALALLPVAGGVIWSMWNVTRERIAALHKPLGELRERIHYNLFDEDVWRDLIEDETEQELKVGAIRLATTPITFGQRIDELFTYYPQMCQKKQLAPWPAWYARRLISPQYPADVVSHLWQYALAQVLDEEFFGHSPRDSALG